MGELSPVRHCELGSETIHGEVSRHAASCPESPAILAAGRAPLSYARLETEIRFLGEQLRDAGIGASDRIAVVLPGTAEAAVAILGISAYAPCAPLDPGCSSRAFEFCLSALGAKAVLLPHDSRSPALAVARSLHLRILRLAPEPTSPAGIFSLTGDKEWIGSGQSSADRNPALLLFTSGTTARPKLVALTHRQLWLSAKNICSAMQLEPGDRSLGVMPLHHIHGLSTLFASLVAGGSYAALPTFSPESFVEGLDEFRPTWYSASPALHRAILDSTAALHEDFRASGLRVIRSASAPMPLSLIGEIETAFGAPLIEAYGMTEAAPQIASNRLPPFVRKPGSVGKAAGPEVAIVDESGRGVEPGETGEVVIRGPNVVERYEGEGEASDVFLDDGWLRTGDLGYLDADGYLFLVGRRDDVINRGGEKIAPEQVEQVLLEHPAISKVVVFGVPHAVLGESVAAAVVFKPGKHLDQSMQAIRDFVAERLAHFAVPQRIVAVDEIPFPPTGKLNRKTLAKALGVEGRLHSRGAVDQTPPRNATERLVAKIFAEVLADEPSGVHANFFDIGGHSLAAMRILARLRQFFQTELPVDALFGNPTVAKLAERIGEKLADMVAEGVARLESQSATTAPSASHDNGLKPRPRDGGPAPLSLAQERIYFLDRLGSGAAYNMSASLWLTGELDQRALGRAISEIVRRHEILRTHFPMRGDHPVQIVSPPHEVLFPVVDLATVSESDRAVEAMRLAAQEAAQPFDLEAGPLFRAKLVRLGAKDAALLLTMHHIVSDGWSIGVLYSELRQLYGAFRQHRDSPLAELPLQYADFADWQQTEIKKRRFDRAADYWTRRLDHLPPACTFPSNRPRPPIQSYRGAVERMFIERDVVDRVRSLAARENVTLFMALLAVFKTLLFRHNGQDDCVVGVPIASRSPAELEPLIGFFADTLVMRTSLAGDPTFIELLSRVRANAIEAFAHQDVPLEQIMKNLRIPRDLSRTPLFQVMFAFQSQPEISGVVLDSNSDFELASHLAARPLKVDNETEKFDLTLYLAEVDGGMSVAWQFSTDLFDSATILRLAWQFRTLLEGVAEDPRKKLSELPLLAEADRRQAEIDWNRTDTRLLGGRNFVQLFEMQVERAPNAPAIQAGDVELSYRDLNEMANSFARYFQGLGVGRDRLVGVCLPRTPEMLAVLLGVWKAGGAFLPLDPDYPPARLAFKLRDAGVSILVTETALLPSLSAAIQVLDAAPNQLPEIVCIDASQQRIASESRLNLESTPAADALAYVIYTSGSTGKPKGVMITHGNVCHYAQALAQAVGVTGDDRYLHTASFSFSSSVRQFTVPLACGAAVVIASKEELRDPRELFKTIRRQGVSVLDFVPSFSWSCLQVLMSLEPASRAHLLDNRVRLMLWASEPLSFALVDGWRHLSHPATTFFNMYGQTETTGVVATYAVPLGGDATAIVPIGRPIANTQAYVLDAARRLVPVGICGELYIGGSGIGRGYMNQPEQTAANFVANPFARQGSKRLCRTGDLARYRYDGVIEIVGRADQQVKIRGFRIEPGEIEAAILNHPGVRECAVTAIDDTREQSRTDQVRTLVAFVVADGQPLGEPASFAAQLRASLKDKLPDYMLPQRIVTLSRLVRTPSGKIDIQALRQAIVSPAASTALMRTEPPKTARPDVESALAEIWRKTLRVDSVRPGDNFFDLGGNSKLSIVVVAEARQAGLTITLRQIYQHQTLAELAHVAVDSKSTPSPMVQHRPAVPDDPGGQLVTVESLRAFGIEALSRAGLAADGARIVTEVQLEASLRGQPTHDMVSIPRYSARIASGKINANPRIQVERETDTTALIDGDNGPGQWVSMVAMDVAMRKARERGIGVVGARRSNHFGAAGHYAWEAARRGLIGLCTTNGPSVLAPTGGITPIFGNNPLAVGIPAGHRLPILLDIAMSVAPRSKIGLVAAEGKPLPTGWILDGLGRPSTDLADLAAGLGVPIGGHKGYGLALVLEVLAGVLSGAGFASDHHPDTLRAGSGAPDYGHLFVAIDQQCFMPASVFAERVDRLIAETKRSELIVDATEVLIPGEKELRMREQSLEQGVRLSRSTYRALVAYQQQHHLAARLVSMSESALPQT